MCLFNAEILCATLRGMPWNQNYPWNDWSLRAQLYYVAVDLSSFYYWVP